MEDKSDPPMTAAPPTKKALLPLSVASTGSATGDVASIVETPLPLSVTSAVGEPCRTTGSATGVGAAEERFWPFLLSSEVILLPTGAFCGVFAPVEPEPTPLPQANRYLSAPSRQESMQSKQSTHLL